METIAAELELRGYSHRTGITSLAEYHAFAKSIGEVVAEERIALRDGAHSYVARPGPVPLHTDQPQIEYVLWYCVQQDERDGATHLLDSMPVVISYTEAELEFLRKVKVVCPPVAGGSATLRFPVLRQSCRGPNRQLVFCSPWLDAAEPIPEHQAALDEFRSRLDAAARTDLIQVRLEPGHVLIIDNQRMLHGRAEIHESSKRCLHRLWAISRESAALE